MKMYLYSYTHYCEHSAKQIKDTDSRYNIFVELIKEINIGYISYCIF